MPCREYVPGRVNIAVVSDTALTGPYPYSKAGSTFRTVIGDSSATRAGLGGVPFIDFEENAACVLAFIGQQRSQCGPTGVEHRLGLFGFRQPRTGHVAHDDQTVVFYQFPAVFVQRIVTPVPDLGVYGPNPVFLPGPLRHRQFLLLVSIEAARFQRFAFGRCGRGFKAQIDANTAGAAAGLRFHRHGHTEVPPAPGVFNKTA